MEQNAHENDIIPGISFDNIFTSIYSTYREVIESTVQLKKYAFV